MSNRHHHKKITSAPFFDAKKPPPPPGLPNIQQRMKSLQLAARYPVREDDMNINNNGHSNSPIIPSWGGGDHNTAFKSPSPSKFLTTQMYDSSLLLDRDVSMKEKKAVAAAAMMTEQKQRTKLEDRPGYQKLVLPPLSSFSPTASMGHGNSVPMEEEQHEQRPTLGKIPSIITVPNMSYTDIFSDDDDEDGSDWMLGGDASIFRRRDDERSRDQEMEDVVGDEMTTKQIWNLRGRTVDEKNANTKTTTMGPTEVVGLTYCSDLRPSSRPRFMRAFDWRRRQTKRTDELVKHEKQEEQTSSKKAEF